jgi:excisionase family DNA binding protein
MQAVTITQISPKELEYLIESSLKRLITPQHTDNQLHTKNQLLNISQVAEYLSLSVPTIYGLVSKSQIPSMKRGKRLYFSLDEITEWVKSGRRKTKREIDTEVDNYLMTSSKK